MDKSAFVLLFARERAAVYVFQVFGSGPSGDMNEKFWDILAFTQQVSRLMVSEIRRRASNQSTETASCAIVKFLEIENSEELSNGWMLLSALHLLAAGDTSLIQVYIDILSPFFYANLGGCFRTRLFRRL